MKQKKKPKESKKKQVKLEGKICIILTTMAIFYMLNLGIRFPYGYYPNVIALGFPMFFDIEHKTLRNIGIILCGITICLSGKFIPFASILIVCIFLLHKKKEILVLGLVIIITLSMYASSAWTPTNKLESPLEDIKYRLLLYEKTLYKWSNYWVGHGLNSFKDLKIMRAIQPQETEPKMFYRAHSDIIQGFYELGILRMFPILILLFLPLAWLKCDMVSASYLCVLLQTCFDFPFYRCTAGYGYMSLLMSVMILTMMWGKRWT